jgi:hypothetical protein
LCRAFDIALSICFIVRDQCPQRLSRVSSSIIAIMPALATVTTRSARSCTVANGRVGGQQERHGNQQASQHERERTAEHGGDSTSTGRRLRGHIHMRTSGDNRRAPIRQRLGAARCFFAHWQVTIFRSQENGGTSDSVQPSRESASNSRARRRAALGPRRRRKSVVDRRHATRHLHHRVHDGCGETTAISVPSGQARSVDEAKGIRDRSVAPP